MSKSTRVIKRYANRKLYDTSESRYVTLEQIAEMIRAQEDIEVVDNATKEDLTSVTLAQIIFEDEKQKRSFLPLSVLRNLIQSSEESFHEWVSKLEESAGRVGRVFRREENDKAENPQAPNEPAAEEHSPVEAATAAPHAPDAAARPESTRIVRDFIDTVQQTIDEWQKRVDANVQSAIESMSPLTPLQKEVLTLRERIAQLETKLAEIDDASEREETPGA